MRVVLLKDSVLGRKGETVTVSDKQAAVLLRTGQARKATFRDEVVTK
jgi:ribosomal protein L9